MLKAATTHVKGELSIELGHVYRAKNPVCNGDGLVDDRQVIYLGQSDSGLTGVQYDSPSDLAFVSFEEFRNWAGYDVTHLYDDETKDVFCIEDLETQWHDYRALAEWRRTLPESDVPRGNATSNATSPEGGGMSTWLADLLQDGLRWRALVSAGSKAESVFRGDSAQVRVPLPDSIEGFDSLADLADQLMTYSAVAERGLGF